PPAGRDGKKGDRDHCLSRSRGGLTTKIHAVVDAQGLPIRLSLTAGKATMGKLPTICSITLEPEQSCRRTRPTMPTASGVTSREGCFRQYPAQGEPEIKALFQHMALPRAEPNRALLLQAQALPHGRNPIRQTSREL